MATKRTEHKPTNLSQQLGVGYGAFVLRVVANPVEGDAVPVAGLDIAVQCVVADVCLCSNHPLDLHRSLSHVEVVSQELGRVWRSKFIIEQNNCYSATVRQACQSTDRLTFRRRFLPVELLTDPAPELLGVVDALVVHLLVLLHAATVRLRCHPLGWLVHVRHVCKAVALEAERLGYGMLEVAATAPYYRPTAAYLCNVQRRTGQMSVLSGTAGAVTMAANWTSRN